VVRLEIEDHHALAAGDAQARLALCLRVRPHVLVLDERMPLMSGLEMLVRIRT
jgi:DNA-binding response OmpR family regulator